MPENNEGKRNTSIGRIKVMFETVLENKREKEDKQKEGMYVKKAKCGVEISEKRKLGEYQIKRIVD